MHTLKKVPYNLWLLCLGLLVFTLKKIERWEITLVAVGVYLTVAYSIYYHWFFASWMRFNLWVKQYNQHFDYCFKHAIGNNNFCSCSTEQERPLNVLSINRTPASNVESWGTLHSGYTDISFWILFKVTQSANKVINNIFIAGCKF